jgi:hypothetical protein
MLQLLGVRRVAAAVVAVGGQRLCVGWQLLHYVLQWLGVMRVAAAVVAVRGRSSCVWGGQLLYSVLHFGWVLGE